MFSFEKLPGLPRERIVEAIAPVLRAHGLRGVELVWRTDSQGRVLSLTIEPDASPASSAPSGAPEAETAALGSADAGVEAEQGALGDSASTPGVTLDLCSQVSRELSTALDVMELIDGAYRLEVGSPGLERKLYTVEDYRRFAGRTAKLKLAAPVQSQYVLEGTLGGVDSEGRVLIQVGGAEHALELKDVRSGQLAVNWQEMGFAPRQRAGRRPAAHGRK